MKSALDELGEIEQEMRGEAYLLDLAGDKEVTGWDSARAPVKADELNGWAARLSRARGAIEAISDQIDGMAVLIHNKPWDHIDNRCVAERLRTLAATLKSKTVLGSDQ